MLVQTIPISSIIELKRSDGKKNILEKPEIIPVEQKIKWVGRENNLKDLKNYLDNNFQAFKEKNPTQQKYNFPFIYGV